MWYALFENLSRVEPERFTGAIPHVWCVICTEYKFAACARGGRGIEVAFKKRGMWQWTELWVDTLSVSHKEGRGALNWRGQMRDDHPLRV